MLCYAVLSGCDMCWEIALQLPCVSWVCGVKGGCPDAVVCKVVYDYVAHVT